MPDYMKHDEYEKKSKNHPIKELITAFFEDGNNQKEYVLYVLRDVFYMVDEYVEALENEVED